MISKENCSEYLEEMKARQGMYAFFSKVMLKEFTEEELERLGDSVAVMTLNERMESGSKRLMKTLRIGGIDFRTRLAVDYAKVFLGIGTGEQMAAIPFESVYTSEEHLIMQDSRDQVVAVYRANGVDVDPELYCPEDHLGFELEFMSAMAGRSAAAIEAGEFEELQQLLETQSAFLQEHLLNWVGSLSKDVERIADTDFYPSLIEMLLGYLEIDSANLGYMLEQ
ncbi:MAG: molecular chaperone [Coriobacteriales bacterium]